MYGDITAVNLHWHWLIILSIIFQIYTTAVNPMSISETIILVTYCVGIWMIKWRYDYNIQASTNLVLTCLLVGLNAVTSLRVGIWAMGEVCLRWRLDQHQSFWLGGLGQLWWRVVGDSSIIFISNKFCLNLNGVPMWNIHHNWNKALCLNLNSINRNIDIAR
jgi:hypothetical protein